MASIYDTQAFGTMMIEYGSFSDKGVKEENEDNFIATKNIINPTFIVADGAGGYHYGKEASMLAVNAFSEELSKIDNSNFAYIRKLIEKKYDQVNRYLYDKSREYERRMMTTFSMANIIEERLLVSNLGDTSVYRINGYEIQRISQMHSLAWEQYENKKITYEEYLNHPRKNVITRALGGIEEVNPYFNEVDIQNKDIYIMCTDGISNFIPPEELLVLLKDKTFKDDELNLLCRSIGEEVLKRGGNDNLTIVVFQVFINKG